MISIFVLLIPVFGFIVLGYLLHLYNLVKTEWVKKLNFFVYYFSLPALIISLFWKIEFTKSTLGFLGFHSLLIIFLSIFLVFLLSLFKINNKTKVAIVLGAVVGNTMYMGYPILRTTYPSFPIEVSMGAGVVQLVVGLLVSLFLIEFFVLKTKKISVYFIDFIKNPLVLATIIGIVLNLMFDNKTDNIILSIISMIGETASPLALFTLGVFMHNDFSKQSFLLGSFTVIAKLVLLPFFVFLASVLFGYNNEFVQISVLISAMPTAITSFVLAQKYDLEEQLATDIILGSTILSVVSIPLILLFL